MTDKRHIRVAAAIFRKDGKILATQRGYGNYKDWWEFPGGKIEQGETAEEALVREIREELKTEIEIEGHLMTVDYEYPEFFLTMDCFWCREAGDGMTFVEHEDARWLPMDDLWQVQWLPADFEVLKAIEASRESEKK